MNYELFKLKIQEKTTVKKVAEKVGKTESGLYKGFKRGDMSLKSFEAICKLINANPCIFLDSDIHENSTVQEEPQGEYKTNPTSEMQIKMLEALIKEKDDLIAEKERLIQILMKSNEKNI